MESLNKISISIKAVLLGLLMGLILNIFSGLILGFFPDQIETEHFLKYGFKISSFAIPIAIDLMTGLFIYLISKNNAFSNLLVVGITILFFDTLFTVSLSYLPKVAEIYSFTDRVLGKEPEWLTTSQFWLTIPMLFIGGYFGKLIKSKSR